MDRNLNQSWLEAALAILVAAGSVAAGILSYFEGRKSKSKNLETTKTSEVKESK